MIRFSLNNIDFSCDTVKETIELIDYFKTWLITKSYIDEHRSQNARYAANVRWSNYRMRKAVPSMSLFSS